MKIAILNIRPAAPSEDPSTTPEELWAYTLAILLQPSPQQDEVEKLDSCAGAGQGTTRIR